MRLTYPRPTVTIAALCACLAPAVWGLEVYGVAPIHKITPHQAPSAAWTPGEIALDCACNESEAFQIVVRSSEPVADLAIELGDLSGEAGDVLSVSTMRPCRVAWVDINAPYEADKASENPDLRPDPLPPIDPARDRFTLEPQANLVFWVSIAVPETASPGLYKGQVRFLMADEPVASLAVELRVRGFALPRRPILESMIGLSAGNIYRAHGCKTPEDKEAVIRLYFEEYIRARLSPFLYATGTIAFNPLPEGRIKWEFLTGPDGALTGEAKLDFTVFDREGGRYFDQRQAFSAFNFAPYLWGRREREGKKELVLQFADVGGTLVKRRLPDGAVNPLYDRLVVSVFRQIAAHLAEKGWLDRAIYYVTDEPGEDDTPALKTICELIREADPRIRTSLTYDPANRPRLAELVQDGKSLISVWIPYCSMYREQVAAEQRRKGANYWLYDVKQNCLISHSGQQNRSMCWAVWQRDAEGYLYYLSTYWGREKTPWERPNFMLPNVTYRYRHGDGYFFYPPSTQWAPETPVLDHVVTTIRWELLRESVEDYEYLRILQDLTAKAQQRGLAAARKGSEALALAYSLDHRIASPMSGYGIRDLQFADTPGWSSSAQEGWLHHKGSVASELPIGINVKIPDGQYDLVLNVYDDSDYNGRPYSRFKVNGREYGTPGSDLKGSTSVEAGAVSVQDGVAHFTLQSLPQHRGVILYRVGLRPIREGASEGLYAVRSAVADAIEALRAELPAP